MDADVVVVGAGLAGLVATAELADAGRRVILLDQEPSQSFGGQAHWSFGGLFLVDSPEQRRLRIRDSRELAWQDWLGTAGFDRDEDDWPRQWAQAYVDFASGEKRSWLHEQGVRFFPIVGWAERGGYLATGHGNSLYVLGAVTIGFKALAVPLGIGLVLRSLDVPSRVPSTLGVPTMVLLGIALSSFSFLTLSRLEIQHAGGALPLSALAVAIAVVLVAFLLMIARPFAPSQVLGFLVLENGASVAGLAVAPGLPLILALLLLFDVFIGVLVFVVLVQYLGVQQRAVTTHVLDRLRG